GRAGRRASDALQRRRAGALFVHGPRAGLPAAARRRRRPDPGAADDPEDQPGRTRMSKGRILVVEDDFDISNMLRIYFTGQGFEVSVARRGNDALSMTRQSLPHLIVLDIMLPDMDGYAVCKQLRTTTRTSHIPIIFLTQKDERSDKIAGLELGADDYITKP